MLEPIMLAERLPEETLGWPEDQDRIRSWLIDRYSAPVWRVTSDDPSPGELPNEIDFDVPVVGGSLLDCESLYQSAKELIFWSRELRRGSSAKWQKGLAYEVFALCSVMTHHGIYAFDEIDPTFYQSMMEAWAKGVEVMFDSANVVEKALARFETVDDLPLYFLKSYPGVGLCFARRDVLRACGLPSGGSRTKAVFDASAVRLGLAIPREGERADSDDIPGFTEVVDEEQTSKPVHQRRQSIFRFMFKNRAMLQCANFRFDPGRYVTDIGRASEETAVPPPDLAFNLHATAYRRTSGDLAGLITRRNVLLTGTVANIRKDYSEKYRWTLSALDYCLCTFVQTGFMTARRPEELRLMRRDCLRGDDEYGWYVRVYIVKNRKAWVWIPVPQSVAHAIGGLLALSPNESGAAPLFSVRCLATGRLRRMDVGDKLQSLAREADAVEYIGENDVPSSWSWTPKHFRRYTAHLHFWGYGGSVAVISHILHHFNVGQSWVYTRMDTGLRKMWKQVEDAFKRNIAKQAIDGKLGGAAGKALTRDAKRLEESIRKNFGRMLIIDPDYLVDGMMEVMRRKLLVLVPKAWIVCSCPATHGAARRALCRKQAGEGTSRAIGPDFSRAGTTVCPGCIWAIENEVTRAFRQKDLEAMKLACAAPRLQGTVLGDLQEGKALKLLELEAA